MSWDGDKEAEETESKSLWLDPRERLEAGSAKLYVT